MHIPLTGALILTWLAACQICTTEARFGFIKDQSMDAVFPGLVYKQSKAIPEGHMRPLGTQRRPDGPIHEELELPGIREFYEVYVSVNNPAVFRQSVTQAPALVTWSDDKYLTDKYGNLNVTVRVKTAAWRSRIQPEKKFMKLKKFIHDYMYLDLYLASILPKEMMPELPLPKCLRCGTLSENLVTAELWMSSGGTSSQLHSHDNHLMHCVLFGRRDFILIEAEHKQAFSWIHDYPGSLAGHSDINADRVNVFHFKTILRVPWTWSTLYPGDCLFVPAGYLHQVRSYGRSVSITVEFFPVKHFDDSGCELKEKEFIPLSDAYFLIVLVNGRLRLQDKHLDVERLRHILIALTDKNDILTREKFEHFYREVLGEDPALPNPTTVYNMLKSGKQIDQLSEKHLLAVESSSLLQVADIFNNYYAELQKREQALAKEEASATTNYTDKVLHEEF